MARPVRIEGDIAIVSLTMGYEAMIDAEDAALVSGRNWQASIEPNGMVYAICSFQKNGKKKTVRMHRLIANADSKLDVDHRDVNGLNNRRTNLRTASRSQNKANSPISRRNTSGLKGICKVGSRWRAGIRKDGKHISLGYFDDAHEAHQAYVEAAQTLFGEFARAS